MTAPPVLQLTGITKRFGPVLANDAVSLTLHAGEVLALLGENGAGKSTLVSILFGHYVADAGTLEAFGRPLPPGDPKAALEAGIGMVHQHFTLADNLTVLDNVVLGTEPWLQPWSRRGAARAKLLATARQAGFAVDPEARVGTLSVGERQRVEIVKALYRGARLLILDEPTAVLTPQESESLFATLRQLVAQGLAVIFISHKLDEVVRVSHRVAVLRGGRLVHEGPTAATDRAALARHMVGRHVELPRRERRPLGAQPVLTLRDIAAGPALRRASLAIAAGEVVGIAGVSGNGQQALAEVLSGTRATDTGELRLGGQPLPASPRAWVGAGVARIPEDRHAVGAVGDLPLWQNAVSERLHLPAFSRGGLISRGAARNFARHLVEHFDVRTPGLDVPARVLSGGNLQKLVLGRALSVAGERGTPRLIVANQPTWGLDIGAVAEVQRRLLAAAAQGAAVLLISDDLDELFALADRIAVMFHGRLGPARATEDWSRDAIGLAMAGATAEPVGEEEPADAA